MNSTITLPVWFVLVLLGILGLWIAADHRLWRQAIKEWDRMLDLMERWSRRAD